MRDFGKRFFVGSGLTLFLVAATSAGADEPRRLMMSGAEVYQERALREIKKQKPEIDVAKLRYEAVNYSYEPERPNSRWHESVQVTFADPSTDKLTVRGDFRSVSSTRFIVQFARDPQHETEPGVQIQTATYSRLLNGSTGPFSDDTKISPPPVPPTNPAATP